MKVSTTSTSTASLAVPYTCHCAYCGTTIRGEEKIEATGYAFKGGYAHGLDERMMGMASNIQASANLPFELEYAENRLEHYRSTVAEGKLKAFLETGKERKEDWFHVEAGSPLEAYLKSPKNKTQWQDSYDKSRLAAWPYEWKAFDKNTRVKCPQCGKTQPWCEDIMGCNGAFARAFVVGNCVFWLGFLPIMVAGVLPEPLRMLALLPLVAGIVVGIVFHRLFRRRKLRQYAALPWNPSDLPRFDNNFLAQARKQFNN